MKDEQGHFWIARDAKLTKVRGGHCVCLKPKGAGDPDAWWDFYDQGAEGACVGFGISRLTSQLNRKLYDGFWLYHEAKKIDEWPARTTTARRVRAGLDILRKRGHCEINEGVTGPEAIGEGIKANRWARSVDDVLRPRLQRPRLRRRPQLVGTGLSPPHPDAREGPRAALARGR